MFFKKKVAEVYGYSRGDKFCITQVKTSDGQWVKVDQLTDDMRRQIERGSVAGSLPFIDVRIATGKAADAALTGDVSELHSAAESGDVSRVADLLAAGQNPNSRSGLKEFTPIALAARNGYAAVIRVLLQAGADPNIANNLGGFPVHAAASMGHAEALCALVEGGARLNVRNGAGQTPLDLATMRGHAHTAKLIKELGG